MAAQIRVLRRRIKSTQSIKKITRAMELIATSRIAKARARVDESRPYAEQITRCSPSSPSGRRWTTRCSSSGRTRRRPRSWSSPATAARPAGTTTTCSRRPRRSSGLLREQGKEPVVYVIGRKGVNYFRFRRREVAASWTGFSEQPSYANAAEVTRVLVAAFMAGAGERDEEAAIEDAGAEAEDVVAVDELHLVYTRFQNMVTQIPAARRMAPLQVEYVDQDEVTGEREHEGEERAARTTHRRRGAPALRVRAGPRTRCSTHCCRSTSAPGCSPRCWSRRRRSRPRASAR